MKRKDMTKKKGMKKKKKNMSFLHEIDQRKVVVIFIAALIIIYIVCFGNTLTAGKKWTQNLVSSNETRTASYTTQSSTQEEDYDSKEDEYLSQGDAVDTMQQNALVRKANESYTKKRLTDASKGIGVGDEIDVDGTKIKFVEKTKVDDNTIQVSYSDYEVLQRIVEAEATGLDEKSKILVANVILNRVRSSEFPNTVEEVVFQEENGVVQFQPISDGRYDTVEVQDDTIDAVNKALLGVDYSQGALYFLARSGSRQSSITWFDTNLTWLFEYEGHEFYK